MAGATAATRGGTGLGLGRMLRQSLLHRRARSLSALLAMTVSAAVATALLTLYSDLDQKLHREFRSFGANVVVTGAAGTAGQASSLPADAVARVRAAAGADAAVAPFGYAVATTDRGTPVVVAGGGGGGGGGMDAEATRRLDSWWKADASPVGEEALLGQKAANFVADERAVRLTYAGRAVTLKGVGAAADGSGRGQPDLRADGGVCGVDGGEAERGGGAGAGRGGAGGGGGGANARCAAGDDGGSGGGRWSRGRAGLWIGRGR